MKITQNFIISIIVCNFFSSIFCGNAILSQNFNKIIVQVGNRPIAVIPNKVDGGFDINPDTLNVICLGKDLDNDWQTSSSNDELPSWWKIEGVRYANPFLPDPKPVKVRKVADIDLNRLKRMFPYRYHTMDEFSGVPAGHSNFLLLPRAERINYFDMSSEVNQERPIADTNSISTSSYKSYIAVSGRIYKHQEDSIADSNYLRVYAAHHTAPISILETNPDGINIQRVQTYSFIQGDKQKDVIAVMYEKSTNNKGIVEFHIAKNGFSDLSSNKSYLQCFEKIVLELGTELNDLVLLNCKNSLGEITPLLFAVSSVDKKIYLINGKTFDRNIPTELTNGNEISIKTTSKTAARTISFSQLQNVNCICYSAVISSYDNSIFYIPNLNDLNDVKKIASNTIAEDVEAIFQDGIVCAITNTYSNLKFDSKDSVTIYYEEYTGIAKDDISGIEVFPNPAKDIITISLPTVDISYLFTIHNEVGEIVLSGEIMNTQDIDVSSLISGTYFVKIGNVVRKIIIED